MDTIVLNCEEVGQNPEKVEEDTKWHNLLHLIGWETSTKTYRSLASPKALNQYFKNQ